MTYLRCTIGRWTIDLDSEEGREAFRLIATEGVRVFRNQPGFVRYRLMLAFVLDKDSGPPFGQDDSLLL